MKKICILSLISIIFSYSFFSTASALTIVNNYRESAEFRIGKLDDDPQDNNDCSQLIFVKLYSKKDNGPVPSITFIPEDFPQNTLNRDEVCILLQHPGESEWYDNILVELKNSINCEIFINSEHTFTAGPGCNAKDW